MNQHEIHTKYIKEHLITEIVSKLPELEALENSEIEHNAGFDGFMSALYNIKLLTRNVAEGSINERHLIAKFMKGDVNFRRMNKSYAQFANEIFIYDTVLPTYRTFLQDVQVSTISIDDWIPTTYLARFGFIAGLSASSTAQESVLVLENMKARGYKLGPRLYLNKEQLLAMCKPLGQYHALSYGLRQLNASLLQRLQCDILPVPYFDENDPNDAENNFFRIAYRIAFNRFYDFFDRHINNTNTFDKTSEADLKLIERLTNLRRKYYDDPARLMEHLHKRAHDREDDARFCAILHGDFTRNNVLFHFAASGETSNELGTVSDVDVVNVKMIDFQLLRFGSPALDLSVFGFLNSSSVDRAKIWMELLQTYHKHMFGALSDILVAKYGRNEKTELMLNLYSFEHFHAHFKRFALFGVLLCMHFLPWNLCSEEERAQIAYLFETNMHGEEFRKSCIAAGGDDVNYQILDIVRFACHMGYMDHI